MYGRHRRPLSGWRARRRSRKHEWPSPFRRGPGSRGRAGLPADAHGEKALGGRGQRGGSELVEEHHGPAPTPRRACRYRPDFTHAVTFVDSFKGRVRDPRAFLQRRTGVFVAIDEKGPVPASEPDPGTSAMMAATIVEALSLPSGTHGASTWCAKRPKGGLRRSPSAGAAAIRRRTRAPRRSLAKAGARRRGWRGSWLRNFRDQLRGKGWPRA